MRHFLINMPHQTALCKVRRPETVHFLTQADFSLHLASFEPCSRTLEMFSEFIINCHLRPKLSISARRHKQPVCHATTAFRATTFQPDSALVVLLRVEAKFDSRSSVPLRVLQPPAALWETGSPRPSDNLLLQRTMVEYFPITGVVFCFCMSAITPYLR